MQETTIKLKFLARFNLENGRPILVIANPSDCADFSWIIGKQARIDGTEYTVREVIFYSHPLPWKKGEPLGLLTEPKAI